jgi:hypothetical protein
MSHVRHPSKAPNSNQVTAHQAAEPQAAPEDLLSSLLHSPAFVAHAPSEAPAGGSLVAVCIDDRHPSLLGRVRVRWSTRDGGGDAWVPTLRTIVVRTGDQVLLNQPLNGPEPVVVGVIDGFVRRAPAPERAAAALVLEKDEVLRVEDSRGLPLLEVRSGEDGPAVRLVRDNVALEVEGKLVFRAAAIRLEAREGTVEIEAADDVCVKGEVVHLN